MDSVPRRVLSWGCGVQSTALAVMAALGDFGLPRVEVAFHADVGWERERTVEMREFYSRWLAAFGIPVVVTEARNIRHDGAKAHVHVPFWTVSGAPLSRQCTREFKIRPVRRALRAWLGLPRVGGVPLPPATVEQWIGFSLDEARRCKSSGVASVVNRFPLVELGLTRTDCALYLQEKRLPVPVKSACIGCPFRTAGEYLQMRAEAPGEFYDACAFDEENRRNPLVHCGSASDEVFVWRERVPLADANLESAAQRETHGEQLGLFWGARP